MEHCENFELGVLSALRLRLENGSSAEIIPALGGTVHSLRLADTAGTLREILRSDSEGELLENRYYRGRFMFPFAGRIPGGAYSWLGREHALSLNIPGEDLALHGFLYRKPMRVLSRESGHGFSALSLCYALAADDEPGYPFSMEVIISYRLDESGFTVVFSAENTGTLPAPLGFGWHPYFMCESPLADLSLSMGNSAWAPVDAKLLPTGGLLPVVGTAHDYARGYFPARNAPLDAAFYTPRDESITLNFGSGRPKVRLTVDRDAFPYTHLFIPPQGDSLAVEPVSSAANAFNLPALGLRVLQAGACASGKIVVALD